MGGDSSSSSSSRSAGSAPATPLVRVKQEPQDAPPRGRSRAIVINELTPRISSRLVKPKLEPGTALTAVKKEPSWTAQGEYVKSALKASTDGDPEKFPGLTFASQASFNEVPSASLDVALAWSAREHEKEEAERKRR